VAVLRGLEKRGGELKWYGRERVWEDYLPLEYAAIYEFLLQLLKSIRGSLKLIVDTNLGGHAPD